ncbi:hypothetical protein CVT24_005720 [Panaeolus cyanescens]|uniref:Inhibitor of growth protein N-terminal histone-binding domain-containing protein n=1 Tax=Panaeolus cyanescens TaxID=181874 RepID=A0A409VCX5_9AGAR|nr:hypothetical protein CVT24_005720 [Panaeolus cyanescens]
MATRKRRREQVFSEEEDEPQQQSDPAVDEEKTRLEKEQEVWEAIREAHFEVIEQLPLTLERQLSLMKQLDQQTIEHTARLLPIFQKYAQQRRAMAGEPLSDNSSSSVEPLPGDTQSPTTQPPNTIPLQRLKSSDSRPSPLPASVSGHNTDGNYRQSNRELLSQIALLAEELLRASQEKVNLAQTNHESVERHIRLLDQAIKEQEAALLSGNENGINIHLPELVVPQWAPRERALRTTSPLADDELDGIAAEPEPISTAPQTQSKVSRRGRKKGGGAGKQNGSAGDKDSSALTIHLPATAATQEVEETYCYCNRGSFGESLIDFQNKFHLGCVGLTEPPAGEWYCEDCRADED